MEIFQRYGQNTHYYARFQARGKRYLWCTRTTDKRLAETRAKVYREKAIAGQFHLTDLMKSANKMPSFAEVFNEYKGLPVRCNKSTRNKNIASFKIILAAVDMSETDGVMKLSKDTALAWQRYCLKPASNGAVDASQHASIATCNSRLRQARSLFSKRAMQFYTLKMPKERIADFMSVPLFKENEHKRALPTPQMLEAAEALLPGHKAEWCAYLLAKQAGLRAGEIEKAERSWLADNMIHVGGVTGAAETKSGKFRSVPIGETVATILRESFPDHPFLCGDFPGQVVRRKLPALLRECGFRMSDPTHSLRRWFGSWVYENYGASAARELLGHSSETVTMRHYARRLTLPPAVPFAPAAAPEKSSS
jgi:integrase